MEQKPKLVYFLIILWIILGVLLLGIFITQIINHLDSLQSAEEFPSIYKNEYLRQITFSYISSEIFFIVISLFAFILAHAAFINKKWCWLIGIMYTSALAFFVYSAIVMIGNFIVQGSITGLGNFLVIVYISMIFFVPCILYILTRPIIKEYFEKSNITHRNY